MISGAQRLRASQRVERERHYLLQALKRLDSVLGDPLLKEIERNYRSGEERWVALERTKMGFVYGTSVLLGAHLTWTVRRGMDPPVRSVLLEETGRDIAGMIATTLNEMEARIVGELED